MINTSDLPTLHSDDVFDSALTILQELGQKALNIETKPGKANPELMTDVQARHRLAAPIFLRHRKDRPLANTELMKLYNLCITPDDQADHAASLYTELTGEETPHLKDVSGVRIPIRAMFVLLWAKGKVTLPHNFTISGVWPKYPELKSESEGFISSIVGIKTSSLYRCTRNFQYRVNWHKPEDVNFKELWEAAPTVIDKQRAIRIANDGNKTRDFSYLAWLHLFAKEHPKIVSPEQARLLEGYHTHLSMVSIDSSSEENRKTYAQFVKYWGSMGCHLSKNENLNRRRIRYTSGIDGRKSKNKQRAEKKLYQAETLIREAYDVLSPEEYAILPGRKRQTTDSYKWVNGYYNTPANPDVEESLARWVRAGELHLGHIESDMTINSRRQEVSFVYILMDYLGIYLPAWLSKHPESAVEFPKHIENFHRSIFWNRKSKITTFKNPEDSSESLLPLTLMQFYDLKRSKKTKSKFIHSVWRYFEVAILNGTEAMPDGDPLVGDLYKNPVHPQLDSTGSGSAGKSNKIPLPIDSMLMVEAYMLALDAIGVELQNKCLRGIYSYEDIQDLKNCTWIDLKKYGISYSIKLWNPNDLSESIDIPLTKIINAYSWRSEKYRSSDHEVYVPWLSQLRMLTVALFSGLRLQNCQWLDVRSFDKHYDKNLRGSLSSCILYVNTDKSGNSRPVTLPYKVMDVLLQERHFQKKEYQKKYKGVNYQNDPQNASKYKIIHPLFRSPWLDNGAPFSDSSYALKWTLILRGFQEVYNSFVPAERRHDFVECSVNGEWSAVHTPHALRATWITHRRVYAFLDYAIIGRQVGHAQAFTTAHYVVPTQEETISLIETANRNVSRHAFAALTGKPPSPSTPESALVKGWEQHRKATTRDQHLISVIPEIMDSEETGLDLITRTKEQRIKFLDCCICAIDGDCPKKLMAFSRRSRTCGICPYAVFGIDHLPGLNAKVRDLANCAEQLKLKLQRTHELQPKSANIEVIHEELSLCMLELAGYRQAIQILEQNWREEKFPNGYIARHRDLSNAVRHSVDMTDPKQRVISMLIDASQFPAFASEHYPLILDELTRNPEFMQVINQPLEEREIYIGQILSIMGGAGISFEEISSYAVNKSSALLLNHEVIRA